MNPRTQSETRAMLDALAHSAPAIHNTEVFASASETSKYGVYQTKVSGRGTVFAVRETDNLNGYGDSFFPTPEKAIEAAKQLRDRDETRARRQVKEQEVVERAAKDKETAAYMDGFADEQSAMVKGRMSKTLSRKISLGGNLLALKEHIRGMVAAGEMALRAQEEDIVKPMTRSTSNRADNREQEDHARRVRETGKHTVYYVNGYDFGKTGYDYAAYLKNKALPAKNDPGEGNEPYSPRV